ncbi:hypothetical protein MTR67_004195 [Solanum verrucosum]|uniref:Uncharacterized protein n=1 Tax=Solanum verrucosum TaxID=315347 RepID=A0AAF0TEV0_SOLVR|nr:hypothetical protein MTR67_004195 [Solanum verrucosum]
MLASSVEGEKSLCGPQKGIDILGSMKDVGGEEQGLSNVKVMCRLCFSSENEGVFSVVLLLICPFRQISSIGVHGDVPHAGFVRAVEEPEIQKSSCFAKGVMQLNTVTVCSLHTRTLAVGLIFAPNTNCHSCYSNVLGNGLSLRYIEILNQHLWSVVTFASAECTANVMASGSP